MVGTMVLPVIDWLFMINCERGVEITGSASLRQEQETLPNPETPAEEVGSIGRMGGVLMSGPQLALWNPLKRTES